MPIKAATRHDADLSIHAHPVYPDRSPYAKTQPGYVDKIKAFYCELGIDSAIWASPVEQSRPYVEIGKECEYILDLDLSRIVAYVNEKTWSPYLYGERDEFEYSRTRTDYEHTSLVICTPLDVAEVILFRKFHRERPDKFHVVEELWWPV